MTPRTRLFRAREAFNQVAAICLKHGFNSERIASITINGIGYEDPRLVISLDEFYEPREGLKTTHFPGTVGNPRAEFWTLEGTHDGVEFTVMMWSAT